MSRRIEKVEKELRQVIANYLLIGFKGKLSGLVSVARVVVSPDLRNAKVFVTVMGSEEETKSNLDILHDFSYDIQREINHRVQMKFCPKLKFFIDTSVAHVLRIEGILQSLKDEGQDLSFSREEEVPVKNTESKKHES